MSDDPIHASPRGGERLVFDLPTPQKPGVTARRIKTLSLQDAIDKAKPGQTVRLTPGVYDEPVVAWNKGTREKPVRIVGRGDVTCDGRRNEVRPRNVEEIDATDFAFLRIIGCHGLVVENLTMQNCWPSAVFIGDSTDIELRGLNLNGATYGIFACGPETRRILVEHCAWLQDPRIWNGVPWAQIHDAPHPRRELDGDFFRSWRIRGDVVIRRNYISHAFNGVHLYASVEDRDGGEPINENVWIYENTFSFIRDNAVEGENRAIDWFVFANRIFNCHVWLALENCTGGPCFVFGNRGWFTEAPGPPGDCYTGGGVIKGSNNRAFPDEPHYMFNNSFYVRGPYLKKGKMKNFLHFNNALDFAQSRFHRAGLVTDGRNPFGSIGTDPPCSGSDAPDAPLMRKWPENNIRFFGDVVRHPLWPEEIRKMGWPVEAKAGAPGFNSAREGDFSLAADSICRNTARSETMRLADRRVWTLPADLNCGAMDDDGAPYDRERLGCPAEPPFPD